MLAIIDGDVLAYSCIKDRWKEKVKDPNVVELDPIIGKKIVPEMDDAENLAYSKKVWPKCIENLNTILADTFADEYLIAVKSSSNFRDDIWGDYKKHRTPSNSVKYIRQFLIEQKDAVEAYYREADDLLRIWAEEARSIGKDFIICGIDKDLKCVPGMHYHTRDRIVFEVSEVEANILFYSQLLQGDSVDGIPGVPKVGPKKAEKLLGHLTSEEDMQEAVVGEYVAYYGSKWYEYLLANGKMLYIQKHLDDWFSIKDWPIVKELT